MKDKYTDEEIKEILKANLLNLFNEEVEAIPENKLAIYNAMININTYLSSVNNRIDDWDNKNNINNN
jgi:hypothetical protein